MIKEIKIDMFSDTAGGLLKREEIEEKYKWNLTDIFPNDAEWEKEFEWMQNNAGKIKEFENRLSEGSDTFLECLKLDEQIGIKLGKLYLYAMLSKDLDLSDNEAQARYDKLLMLYAKISEFSSFLKPEILSLGKSRVDEYLASKEELKIYQHEIDDIFRTEKHTLPKEQERLMALASPVTEVPYNTFSLLENADIVFPKVEDEEGNEIEISHGRYISALYSQNRDYRRRVYKGYYEPIIQHKNTLSSLFNGNIKSAIFNAKARNYSSTLEAALHKNNIPVEVYHNLVEAVKNNLTPLQEWAKFKKSYLKLDELHPYDSYVTLFPTFQKKYSYEEGKAIVLKALEPMGEEYIKQLQYAFDNRWVDVYETKAKRSGAYSSGTTYGVHPYVLMNWNDTLNDVFTLAHEMGHCLHSYLTIENQPYPYADYTIFLAEVASTTNEALLLNYLIENAESAEEKKFLIEKFIVNAVTTFYRQTRFAEFEMVTHQ
ncbi:MAG: oligoendopeptidase F, partial [Ignavibacteria bacterium]